MEKIEFGDSQIASFFRKINDTVFLKLFEWTKAKSEYKKSALIQ